MPKGSYNHGPRGITLVHLFEITHKNTLAINTKNMMTNVEGVFAAGDTINGPTTVVEAMASGKKVAESVDVYLSGEK